MILLTGATGKIGRALVATLQAQQIPFRALAHTTTSYERLKGQQIDTVLAPDLSHKEATAAFKGIDRLFLLTPNSPDQAATECGVVDVAKQAGVQHIVKLSVFGVDDPAVSLFQAHRDSEKYIQQAGVGYTFLRPNLFMQNVGTTDAALIKQQNSIFNSAGSGVVSFIDTCDIAAVAVAVLRGDQHYGQTYNLTGPEALSYSEIAQKLTTLLDRSIQYVALSDDAYQEALLSAGVPGWFAEGLVGLYQFYRAGKGAAVTDLVERIKGTPARSFKTYFADHRTLFE